MLPPGPAPAATRSAADGRFAAFDLASAPTRLEVWGEVDGESVRFACEDVVIEADTLTVIVVEPLRADGPDECGI